MSLKQWKKTNPFVFPNSISRPKQKVSPNFHNNNCYYYFSTHSLDTSTSSLEDEDDCVCSTGNIGTAKDATQGDSLGTGKKQRTRTERTGLSPTHTFHSSIYIAVWRQASGVMQNANEWRRSSHGETEFLIIISICCCFAATLLRSATSTPPTNSQQKSLKLPTCIHINGIAGKAATAIKATPV